ncbi:MAG: hypothetical protein CMD92_03595 [Gammaproteobacteria bacterium]|nr:hypothetical protein [Gammaproteobacteria bacterium]|tara:strand:- start:6017 stop:6409 length:393 start_codon:yes stop_codon:yes gene_type:complete
MTKTAAPAASSLERERFSKMQIRELYGMIGPRREHLRNNISNGVFKKYPHVLDGLLYACETRKDELEQFQRDWARRPRVAFEANFAKRRAEAEAYEDAVVELQPTGKGGVRRYVVPRANVELAAQRPDKE